MSTTPPTLDIAGILEDTSNRVVVCCGAGGVGKTTTAAAMALRAAEYGRTVVVLTIDPAKRLAQALGISDLGNTPQRVPLAPEVPGELYAMMLDMRRTFDEMVIQYSGPDRAQAILDNQFYQTVATSLAGTQEYMAMEKLGQLLAEDRWDLVVVDTPPSRNALDFLDAPKRLGSFMDSRLWRAAAGARPRHRATGDRRGRLGDEGAVDRPGFADALRRGEFRAVAGRDLRRLPGEGRPHLLVAQAARHPVRRGVGGRTGRAAGGVVLRRPAVGGAHAAGRADPEPHASDAVLIARGARHRRRRDIRERRQPNALTKAVLQIHADRAATSKREIRLLSRFTGANPHVAIVGVPSLPFDVSDLEALRAIADQMTRSVDDAGRNGPLRTANQLGG